MKGTVIPVTLGDGTIALCEVLTVMTPEVASALAGGIAATSKQLLTPPETVDEEKKGEE